MPNEVPLVPQTPIVGGGRPTAASQRQQSLQRMADDPKHNIFRRIQRRTIQSGGLVVFNYTRYKHDPYPLVLCTSIYQDGKVAGVNLHYMTFKYIRYLVKQYCGKQFSYPLIKGNQFIYNSFRTYRREFIRSAKLLDCDFLLNVLGTVRSFRPEDVEAIRNEVQRQLRKRLDAEDALKEYMGATIPDPKSNIYTGHEMLDRFGEPHWPHSVPTLKSPKPTLDDLRFNPRDLLPPQ